ncbi:hypothetical protein O3M35_011599 [Rhynocoris fuscipes]|uniref:Uncharacterized protein n=1 Tax=Rhynocoris fuscipes TaxID=488301 RepID=A0AAW1D227_9HEMI
MSERRWKDRKDDKLVICPSTTIENGQSPKPVWQPTYDLSWTLVSAIIIIFLLATGTVIVGGRQSVSDDDITEQQQQHQQQTAELVHSELEEEDEESDHIDLEDRTISPLGCKLASQSIHISQDNTAQFIQLNITHPLFITSLLTKLVQGVTYSGESFFI